LIIEDDGGDVEKTIKTTKNNKKNNQTHQIKNDLSVESLNNNSDGNGDDSEEKSGSGEESGDKSGEEGGGGKPKLYGSILKHPGKVRRRGMIKHVEFLDNLVDQDGGSYAQEMHTRHF